MIFSELMAVYASYQATKNIKRYITGASIIFGKSFTIPILNIKIPANGPVNNRLQIFNSFLELGAGRNYSGQAEWLDTKTYSELKDIILEPSILKQLMEYDGNPYNYLTKYAFNVSAMHNGQRKYFRYLPSQMLMVINFTPDYATFEKFKAAAAYEKDCQQFVIMAQRNARVLAALSLDKNLTPAERANLDIEITKHMYVINDFKSTLPAGFYLDTKQLKPNEISGTAIGIIPVIIWVVAIVVSGIVGLTAYYITRQADIAKMRAQLDARYKSIMSITNDATRNAALVDAAKTDNQVLQNESSNTGMLGQLKQIAFVVAGAIVLKEVLPMLSKSKSKS